MSKFLRHLDLIPEIMVRNRISLFLWVAVIGFTLVVTSLVLGIGSVNFKGLVQNTPGTVFDTLGNEREKITDFSKEVGFLSALNWSLFCTFLAPAITWFSLTTLRCFDTTLSELCAKGMARNEDFGRVTYTQLKTEWSKHMHKNKILIVFITSVVIIFVMSDWWIVVGHALVYPHTVDALISDPVLEYDWSISAIFDQSNVPRLALFAFGFIAYLIFSAFVPALAIAVCLSTVYFMLFVTNLKIEDQNNNTQPVYLAATPEKTQNDQHFGFKVFSDLFQNFLLMSIFILSGLWFMAMQNIFLRDLSSQNIYEFILGDTAIFGGILSWDFKSKEIIEWFTEVSTFFVFNIQVALSALLFPFICIASVIGCWYVLRTTAKKGQQFSLAHTEKLADEHDMSADVLQERLEQNMVVWPVGWITSQRLLLLMLFMFIALISYRFIIFSFLLVGVVGLEQIIRNILGSK